MPYNMETSENWTQLSIEDELTSLQEAFHASPTAQQERGSEKRMSVTCGQRCLESFAKFNRATSWAKMFAASLVGMKDWSSTRCKLTWKMKATKSHRIYFQLVPSMLPTEEIGSGLLLIPTTVMTDEPPEKMRARANRKGYKNTTKYGSLLSQVKYSGMLPTVKTFDSHKQRKLNENGENISKTTGTKYGIHLTQMAEAGMLPTPNAMDWNTARSEEALKAAKEKHGSALQDTLRQRAGQGSQLNPRFVAEMMGFPPNWTELPFQSGETKA